MERTKLFGIIGGICVFVVILLIIFQQNSDFDQHLIESINAGTPTNQLLTQIDNEREKEIIAANNRLNAKLNDMSNWNKTDIDPVHDSELDIDFYNQQLEAINNYYELRKQFVLKEITAQEFVSQSKDYKMML